MIVERTVQLMVLVVSISHVISFQPILFIRTWCSTNHVLFSSNDEYREISDVVGGLHGGKYQFNDYGGFNSFDDSFSGFGLGDIDANHEEKEPIEVPKWAMRMEPDERLLKGQQYEIINVPSNSDPMDGMIYSSSVMINNAERTWETFFVKIMTRNSENMFVELDNEIPISANPRSGSLAPKGGASNICDESKPYSDGATIQIVYNDIISNRYIANEMVNFDDLWLVVGTEEEKWLYKLTVEK